MKIILVADAHSGSPESDFEDFFKALSAIPEDSTPVIFLGDIFDICFAVKNCEMEFHRRFFDWCRKEKSRRYVGFVEGNREFFIYPAEKDSFTVLADTGLVMDGMLFIHGDMLNSDDRFYRCLRIFVRNPLIRFLLSVCPGANSIVYKVKAALKRSNKKHKKTFPEGLVRNYVDKLEMASVQRVFCGHFHQHFELESAVTGIKITGIDSWENCRKFAVFDSESGLIEYKSFQAD